MYKNYKERSFLAQKSQNKSRNNDIDECSNNVRRNLNFSSQKLDESVSMNQESLKNLDSRAAKMIMEPTRGGENQRGERNQHRELPKFLQTEGNQSDTYYKSHILDNAQQSDTRMSVQSRSNLSAAKQNLGLNLSMLDNSINGGGDLFEA